MSDEQRLRGQFGAQPGDRDGVATSLPGAGEPGGEPGAQPGGEFADARDPEGDPRGRRSVTSSAVPVGDRPPVTPTAPGDTLPARSDGPRHAAAATRPAGEPPLADDVVTPAEPTTAPTTGADGRAGSAHRRRILLAGARTLLRVGILVAVVVAATVLVRAYVIGSYFIPSASMEPTLHGCAGCNDDHVLVNKLSYRTHGINRGDVVVFDRPPGAPSVEKVLIKRVIGLPGDKITDSRGKVYINGLLLDEPYVNPRCVGGTTGIEAGGIVVPAGKIFVMGDNRCDSSDSRVFGAVPESSVDGRAFVIIWPLGRIHYL